MSAPAEHDAGGGVGGDAAGTSAVGRQADPDAGRGSGVEVLHCGIGSVHARPGNGATREAGAIRARPAPNLAVEEGRWPHDQGRERPHNARLSAADTFSRQETQTHLTMGHAPTFGPQTPNEQ